jgi:proliferating cell nuclear antigen
MKFLLEKCQTFKKLIDSIKDLIPEATLECSSEEILMQAMDSSHVCLCKMVLKKSGFSEYTCPDDFVIGLSVVNLSKILKCAQNTDSLDIKASKENENLDILFKGSKKNSKFEMKLMEIDQEGLEIPETEYPCEISIKSSEFQKIIKDLSSLGDTCEITVSEEGVKFSIDGDVGKAEILLEKTDDCQITCEDKVKVSRKYAIRYLSDFTKATSLSDKVLLKISNEAPLLVSYSFNDSDSATDMSCLEFYLGYKNDDE